MVSLEKHELLNSDPPEALKDTFIKTNAALMVSSIHYMTSGTTCVAVYMRGSEFWVAHVVSSLILISFLHPLSE